jgi:hypothetical protein
VRSNFVDKIWECVDVAYLSLFLFRANQSDRGVHPVEIALQSSSAEVLPLFSAARVNMVAKKSRESAILEAIREWHSWPTKIRSASPLSYRGAAKSFLVLLDYLLVGSPFEKLP